MVGEVEHPRYGRLAHLAVGLAAVVAALVVVPWQVADATGSGSVQATVTDSNGHHLTGACLYAATKKSTFTSAPSTSSGSLSETGVPDGQYHGVLYNCAEPYPTNDGGVPVAFTVRSGRTTDLGTVALPAGGWAYGLLYDAHTVDASEVSVTAWDPTTQVLVAPPVCTQQGFYQLPSLPAAGVKLEFGGGHCPDDGGYVAQWSGGSSWSTAAVFPVTVGLYTPIPSTTLATTESSPNGKVTITGVSFSGEPGDPEVTVTGTDFGKAAPTGAAPTCAEPPSGAGLDYAKGALYLHDGEYTPWQAGDVGDCIGLVVTTWSPTRVVFSPGSWYGWSQGGVAQGIGLFDGDPFMVAVKGAHLTGIVVPVGSVQGDLVTSVVAAHALAVADGSFPLGSSLLSDLDAALPGYSFTFGYVSATGAPHSVSVIVSPDQEVVIFAGQSSDNRCWYAEDNEESSPNDGGVPWATDVMGVSYGATPLGLDVPYSPGCSASDPYVTQGPGTSAGFSGFGEHFPT